MALEGSPNCTLSTELASFTVVDYDGV